MKLTYSKKYFSISHLQYDHKYLKLTFLFVPSHTCPFYLQSPIILLFQICLLICNNHTIIFIKRFSAYIAKCFKQFKADLLLNLLVIIRPTFLYFFNRTNKNPVTLKDFQVLNSSMYIYDY